MARMLGSGAADKAGAALAGRKKKLDKAIESDEAGTTKAGASNQMRDATKGATADYQMQQAIEMVRKKKSAKRTDY